MRRSCCAQLIFSEKGGKAMNSILDKIYNKSPFWSQNLMCSVYGYKLYHERYNGPWATCFNELLKSQYFSEEKIRVLQNQLFKDILKHSLEYVPYYRNILKISHQLENEEDFSALLKKFPIIDKEILRSNALSFVSQFYSTQNLLKYNTSGTTGSPLTVYMTQDARRINYAFYERAKKWAGVALFDKSITFAGRTIVPANQNKPPFWRMNYKFNNTLFSSYHLSRTTLPEYINKIRKLRPVFVDAYPSSINQIATYCLEKKITDIRFKAVITSAEMCLDSQREKIERAFGCKVYDQYGCTEQAVFACQCEEGRYHVNPEFGIIEVLDSKNNPVANGELGHFVCTNFLNHAMPLIRYKIGDMGIMSSEKCSCGRNFPVIKKIYGRNDDVLLTPDGRYVGRLDPVFKGVESSIIETQIVQEKIDLVKIFIVRDVNYLEDHGRFIINELKKRMGENIFYEIVYVENIPRTKSGKFRAVINKISEC